MSFRTPLLVATIAVVAYYSMSCCSCPGLNKDFDLQDPSYKPDAVVAPRLTGTLLNLFTSVLELPCEFVFPGASI
jgi:hypothetical protein